MEGRFEEMAGLKGYFHFAGKKGYSGVAVYTRHAPSDVIVGYGSPEFDAEGRYVELRFDTPAQTVHHQLLFPQRLVRRAAATGQVPFPRRVRSAPGAARRASATSFSAATSISRTRSGPEELAQQPQEQRLPAGRAGLDDEAALESGLVDVYRSCSPRPPRTPTPGGATAAKPTPTTWGGGSITTWPRRGPRRARTAAIYKATRFSDHAPLTIDYDLAI